MICRTVLGRADDAAGEVDWVDLAWPQTLRRALRLISRAGRRVDVLLPPGGRLAHGDVLAEAAGDARRLAVWLEEIEVLAVRVTDPVARGRLAFDLGNRHLPAQITPDAILTPDDGPARAVAAAHGLACAVVRARFYPEPVTLESSFRGEDTFKIAGASGRSPSP